MTMAAALRLASERGCFARPVSESGYGYRYRVNGKQRLLSVSAKAGRNRDRVVEEFNPCLSQKHIEDEWQLCDSGGEDLKEPVPGLTLSDLAV